jgi:uncharacterized damage-inducible protein DinB
MTAIEIFRKFSAGKLRQLAGRLQVCLRKLDDDQIWSRGGPNENAVGNLVLHLCGNVRQWIGISLAGLDDTRKRHEEFETKGGLGRADLSARLSATVNQAAGWIESAPEERFLAATRVQNYDVTGLEAVYHVVEHFAGHTGQIIFITKRMTGEDLAFYGHLEQAGDNEQMP